MESSLATGMRLLLDIVTLALYVQILILFYEASDLTFYVLHWEHTKKQDRAMCPKQKFLVYVRRLWNINWNNLKAQNPYLGQTILKIHKYRHRFMFLFKLNFFGFVEASVGVAFLLLFITTLQKYQSTVHDSQLEL